MCFTEIYTRDRSNIAVTKGYILARRGSMTPFCRELPSAFIIDVLKHHCSESRFERMNSVLSHRISSIALGLEDLNHSHNAIACIRTAESLGVHDVVTAELRNDYPLPEEDATSPRTNRKLSMHSHHWVDMHRFQASMPLVQWAHERGMKIYGTSPHAEMNLYDLPVDAPMLILFGNEKDGLRPETQAVCDASFRVPMFGFTESFNLSVCAGMVLSNVVAKKRARLALAGKTGDLSTERQQSILARWLVRDIRGAELILRRARAELDQA